VKHLVIAALCSFSWIASASAQTCTGSVPYAGAPLQAGIQVAFSSNSHTLVPGVGYGKNGYFARGAFDITSFSGEDASAKGILGMAGAEYKYQSSQMSKALFLCPIVTISKVWGPSVDNGFDQSSTLFGIGGNVGFVATKAGQATVIPTVGLSFNHLSATSTLNFTPAFGNGNVSSSESTNFGMLQIGVGLFFNEKMSLVPSVIIPMGLDGGETSFGVFFATKIGQ
jgi:hypothetical protein